jgi:hypothetical protein
MFHSIAKFCLRIALKDGGICNAEALKIRKTLKEHGLGNNNATRDNAAFAILKTISGEQPAEAPEVVGKSPIAKS